MDTVRVMSVDPGGTTGYTYARIMDGKVEAFPFQLPDDVDEFWQRLVKFSPDQIVMENFEFRGRARTGLNLFPVQLIGVARLYELTVAKRTCVVHLQSASMGKGYYTDVQLKNKKMYKRGVSHGMDAMRHFLHWTTFAAGHKYVTKPGDTELVLLNEWSE